MRCIDDLSFALRPYAQFQISSYAHETRIAEHSAAVGDPAVRFVDARRASVRIEIMERSLAGGTYREDLAATDGHTFHCIVMKLQLAHKYRGSFRR